MITATEPDTGISGSININVTKGSYSISGTISGDISMGVPVELVGDVLSDTMQRMGSSLDGLLPKHLCNAECLSED